MAEMKDSIVVAVCVAYTDSGQYGGNEIKITIHYPTKQLFTKAVVFSLPPKAASTREVT